MGLESPKETGSHPTGRAFRHPAILALASLLSSACATPTASREIPPAAQSQNLPKASTPPDEFEPLAVDDLPPQGTREPDEFEPQHDIGDGVPLQTGGVEPPSEDPKFLRGRAQEIMRVADERKRSVDQYVSKIQAEPPPYEKLAKISQEIWQEFAEFKEHPTLSGRFALEVSYAIHHSYMLQLELYIGALRDVMSRYRNVMELCVAAVRNLESAGDKEAVKEVEVSFEAVKSAHTSVLEIIKAMPQKLEQNGYQELPSREEVQGIPLLPDWPVVPRPR